MIREYISKAMTGAQYKMLSDDGSWYGEIRASTVLGPTAIPLRSAALSWRRFLRSGCYYASPSTWMCL